MGREVIPSVHGRDPVSPDPSAFPSSSVAATLPRDSIRNDRPISVYVPDQIHEDDARSPAAGT